MIGIVPDGHNTYTQQQHNNVTTLPSVYTEAIYIGSSMKPPHVPPSSQKVSHAIGDILLILYPSLARQTQLKF